MKSKILLILTLAAGSSFAAEPLGVPNFHTVNDHLYRGAQPTIEGFGNLAKLGVKTIVDLREAGERSLAEQKVVEAAGMRYVSVPMRGFQAPTTSQISQVFALLHDISAGPIFVHCLRGADRTGTVVACYRIEHDHWDNSKALTEARTFGMSWLE